MILYNIPYDIKYKIFSYYIIDEIREKINKEIIDYHTKNIVKKILNEIIENILKELSENE